MPPGLTRYPPGMLSYWKALFILVPVAAAATPPPTTPGPLTPLMAAAGVGTDPAFERVMAGEKQRPGHTAPTVLRQLLTSREVLRMSAEQGYAHKGGKHMLVWWFSELGFAGSVTEVRAGIEARLSESGFTRSPAEAGDSVSYSRTADGVTQHVDLRGPRGWTGGSREACGVELAWRVVQDTPAPPLTVAEVLTALPFLRDDRIDAPIWAGLAALPAAAVMLGGTWTRYYSLSAQLVAPADGGALRDTLVALLKSAGFEDGRAEDGRRNLERKRTGSFAQVFDPTPEGVRLHVQPES